jgi:hypothetical protein
MLKHSRREWRRQVVIFGCIAGIGALCPMSALAQEQPQLSGAAVEVGGVTVTGAGGAPVSSTAPSSGAVQGRQLLLPNTGTGPVDDNTNPSALVIAAGVLALGAGAYLHGRRSKNRVGS